MPLPIVLVADPLVALLFPQFGLLSITGTEKPRDLCSRDLVCVCVCVCVHAHVYLNNITLDHRSRDSFLPLPSQEEDFLSREACIASSCL